MRGNATRGNEISVGDYALQAMTRNWIDGKQIESARKVIVREMMRKGKLWIRIFPNKPFTKKPAEVRMGKGKGDVEGYVAVVKPGRILYEIQGVEESLAREAFALAAQKLPVKTKFVTRADLEGGIV